MSTDSYVQVAADGSGKKIRNIAVTDPQGADSSGNAQADTVRYQQVTTSADKHGDLTSQADILGALEAINETLLLILEQLA